MQNITIERRLEGRFLINLFIKNTNNKINWKYVPDLHRYLINLYLSKLELKIMNFQKEKLEDLRHFCSDELRFIGIGHTTL